MQYLSELPEVSSIGRDGDLVELELEQEIEELPNLGDSDPIVLVARYGGDLIVVAGEVVSHDNIEGPQIWCRLKFKHSMYGQFSILQ